MKKTLLFKKHILFRNKATDYKNNFDSLSSIKNFRGKCDCSGRGNFFEGGRLLNFRWFRGRFLEEIRYKLQAMTGLKQKFMSTCGSK